MSDLNIRLERLEESVHTIKREVDALQIESAKLSRPWYKTPAVMVAVVAILFSFGTTAVSYIRTLQQDTQAARRELRALIQRLRHLPKDGVDLSLKYSHHPAFSKMMNDLTQEGAMLAAQAADIATSISDHLSTPSLLAVADSLAGIGELQRSTHFAKIGVTRARNFQDETAALRFYAQNLFMTGDFNGGAQQFQIALDAIDKYPKDADPKFKAASHIRTLIYWGRDELRAGRCEEAITRSSEANERYSTLGLNPEREELGKMLRDLDQALSQTCPRIHSKNPELGSTTSSK